MSANIGQLKNMKTYQIYDGENSDLFKDLPAVEAKTAKEAILKYLKSTGRNYKIKRSGENDVLFKATPFYFKGENRIKNGNCVWYKKI